MLIVILGVDDFHVVDLMTSPHCFDSQYFVNNVSRRSHLHLDTCRVHFSEVIEQFIIENHLLLFAHPPDSPDLAPSAFCLLSFRSYHIKNSLVDHTFNEPEELLKVFTTFLDKIQPSESGLSATGYTASDGLWRIMETIIANKSIINKNFSPFHL
jgi:hypothetical protein